MNEGVKAVAVRAAPPDVQAYLEKLTKVCGWKEPVQIGVIATEEMPRSVGVTDNPHGFLRLRPGEVPLIVVRADMLEEERWQSVVAHEFLHLLRWSIDEFVLRRLPDHEHEIYMRMVEDTMKPLMILLLVGGMMNAEWVEGESN